MGRTIFETTKGARENASSSPCLSFSLLPRYVYLALEYKDVLRRR